MPNKPTIIDFKLERSESSVSLHVNLSYYIQAIKQKSPSLELFKKQVRGYLREGMAGILWSEITSLMQSILPSDSPLLKTLQNNQKPYLFEGFTQHFAEIILNAIDAFTLYVLDTESKERELIMDFSILEAMQSDSLESMCLLIRDNGKGFDEKFLSNQSLFFEQVGDCSSERKEQPVSPEKLGGNGRGLRVLRDWFLRGVVRTKSRSALHRYESMDISDGLTASNKMVFDNQKAGRGAVIVLKGSPSPFMQSSKDDTPLSIDDEESLGFLSSPLSFRNGVIDSSSTDKQEGRDTLSTISNGIFGMNDSIEQDKNVSSDEIRGDVPRPIFRPI